MGREDKEYKPGYKAVEEDNGMIVNEVEMRAILDMYHAACCEGTNTGAMDDLAAKIKRWQGR